ncbi:MAG: glycosyl hydrolase family protein [Myxococcales bacterium]|nr:MAG: glycosyl hydrolase family protein [Myxococcales bacterium]
MRNLSKTLGFVAATLCPQLALAVSSAELYSGESYGYGRVEARVQYAAGDGVVSSFFMWKDKSEQTGVFWNELDFEKLGAECRMETNPIYGLPSANHSQKHTLALDMCGAFHTYTYEWTPEAVVWLIDGQEIRRDVGATPQAFAENAATAGMQIHFNLWPGDATFGGNFDPAILPVHEYVDWVQFSKYEGGEFKLAWREDFDAATVPAGWLTGSWASPKNKSTHAPENVNFINGYAVLSLTADDALGPAGAMPGSGSGGGGGAGGGGSTAGAGGTSAPTGGTGNGSSGSTATGGSGTAGTPSGTAGTPSGTAGTPSGTGGTGISSGGTAAVSGSPSNAAPTDGGCSTSGPRSSSVLGWLLGAAALGGSRKRRRS